MTKEELIIKNTELEKEFELIKKRELGIKEVLAKLNILTN